MSRSTACASITIWVPSVPALIVRRCSASMRSCGLWASMRSVPHTICRRQDYWNWRMRWAFWSWMKLLICGKAARRNLTTGVSLWNGRSGMYAAGSGVTAIIRVSSYGASEMRSTIPTRMRMDRISHGICKRKQRKMITTEMLWSVWDRTICPGKIRRSVRIS